jgi:hypothetical protein
VKFDRLIVIAGTYQEFVDVCHLNNVSSRWLGARYIEEPNNIRGYHITDNDKVVFWGRFYERQDWEEMREYLKHLFDRSKADGWNEVAYNEAVGRLGGE